MVGRGKWKQLEIYLHEKIVTQNKYCIIVGTVENSTIIQYVKVAVRKTSPFILSFLSVSKANGA